MLYDRFGGVMEQAFGLPAFRGDSRHDTAVTAESAGNPFPEGMIAGKHADFAQ
jgi:hypothetical protein